MVTRVRSFIVVAAAAFLVCSVEADERSPVAPPSFSESGTAESSSATVLAAAKARGILSATGDIKRGVKRILTYGRLGQSATGSDETTGYPVQPVAGCLVTQRFLAEVEAYNDTMRKWHSAHKP